MKIWVCVLLVFIACLPTHAQDAPAASVPEPFPKELQDQVDAKFEAANPASTPQGLTFTAAVGYSGPAVEPFHPGEAHHVAQPSVVVNADEKLIYCTTGTTLALAGTAIAQSYLSVALEADHRPYATDDVCKLTQEYLFYWKAAEPGNHALRVVFTPDDGTGQIVVRTVRVVVSDDAPCALGAIPSPCETDTQVPITRANVPEFKTARSMVIVGGEGFDLADARKTLDFPATKLPHGAYWISIASFAADGTRFVTMPQIVSVQHPQ